MLSLNSLSDSRFDDLVLILHLAGQLLPDQHDHADVGRDVDQVGHQALIETSHALVPPSLFDAVPGAVVSVMVVLQPCPDHLVRVGGRRCDQLGDSREGQVLGGGLWVREHTLVRRTK